MAFSYSDVLTVDRDKVRFRIGDTQLNAGPRPDGRNFSDLELDFILSEEDSRVNGAIAHSFEILENEWSQYALSEKLQDVSFDAREVADNYAKRAAKWRKKPGGADDEERGSAIVAFTRHDAYTDAASSEYT